MKNDVITYHSDLPVFEKNKKLTSKAMNVEACIICSFEPSENPNEEAKVYLSAADLVKRGAISKNKKSDIATVLKELSDYTINLPLDIADYATTEQYENAFHEVNLITSRKYDGKDTIEIGISPALVPFISNLKKKFTRIELYELLSISSAKAKRLYYLLKTVEFKNGGKFEVDTLKQALDCNLPGYDRFDLFRTRVLNPAVKQINEDSDIYCEFQTLRTGRNISHIEFRVLRNLKHHPKLLVPESVGDQIPQHISELLAKIGINNEQPFFNLIDKYGDDIITKTLKDFWDSYQYAEALKNKAGFFMSRVNILIQKSIREQNEIEAAEKVANDKAMAAKMAQANELLRVQRFEQWKDSKEYKEEFSKLKDQYSDMFKNASEKTAINLIETMIKNEFK